MAPRSDAVQPRYEHTQRSPGLLLLFGVLGAITLASLAFPATRSLSLGLRLTLVASALSLVGAGLVFWGLTIGVDDERLTWHFGAGLFGKAVPLGEIVTAKATTVSWMNGIGIHLTTRGWLYNVGGRGAVLVSLRDGREFLVGTDEPDALVRALAVRQ